MKIIFLLFIVLITTSFSHPGRPKEKTILVIVAHPDDENMAGGILAKYARMNYRVQVVIATDGREGTRVTKIPAGDSLANLRKLESICACEKLGINKPIYLSFDRLDTKLGAPQLMQDKKAILGNSGLLNSYMEC